MAIEIVQSIGQAQAKVAEEQKPITYKDMTDFIQLLAQNGVLVPHKITDPETNKSKLVYQSPIAEQTNVTANLLSAIWDFLVENGVPVEATIKVPGQDVIGNDGKVIGKVKPKTLTVKTHAKINKEEFRKFVDFKAAEEQERERKARAEMKAKAEAAPKLDLVQE